MKLLRNGRWNHQMATVEEINATLKELKEKVAKYHWENQRIAPYGYYITVKEFLDNYTDVGAYSFTSRSIMISEINGFIKNCVEPWEKTELEPKVKIKLQNGIIKDVAESTAKDFVELGFATFA